MLAEWEVYRLAQPRSDVLHWQQCKDQLDEMASTLNMELCCLQSSAVLEMHCLQFNSALTEFKEKILVALLSS